MAARVWRHRLHGHPEARILMRRSKPPPPPPRAAKEPLRETHHTLTVCPVKQFGKSILETRGHLNISAVVVSGAAFDVRERAGFYEQKQLKHNH